MLTLTDGATAAIEELVGAHSGAGLRIFSRNSDSNQMQLGLSVSDGPQPTDEVVEQSGCQIFLDAQVAPLVDGRTLDARRTEGQEVEFAFIA